MGPGHGVLGYPSELDLDLRKFQRWRRLGKGGLLPSPEISGYFSCLVAGGLPGPSRASAPDGAKLLDTRREVGPLQMDGQDFSTRYRLVEQLTKEGVYTYLAVDTSDDDAPVMVHFLREGTTPLPVRRTLRLMEDLSRLSAMVRNTLTWAGTRIVVTRRVPGFSTFEAWFESIFPVDEQPGSASKVVEEALEDGVEDAPAEGAVQEAVEGAVEDAAAEAAVEEAAPDAPVDADPDVPEVDIPEPEPSGGSVSSPGVRGPRADARDAPTPKARGRGGPGTDEETPEASGTAPTRVVPGHELPEGASPPEASAEEPAPPKAEPRTEEEFEATPQAGAAPDPETAREPEVPSEPEADEEGSEPGTYTMVFGEAFDPSDPSTVPSRPEPARPPAREPESAAEPSAPAVETEPPETEAAEPTSSDRPAPEGSEAAPEPPPAGAGPAEPESGGDRSTPSETSPAEPREEAPADHPSRDSGRGPGAYTRIMQGLTDEPPADRSSRAPPAEPPPTESPPPSPPRETSPPPTEQETSGPGRYTLAMEAFGGSGNQEESRPESSSPRPGDSEGGSLPGSPSELQVDDSYRDRLSSSGGSPSGGSSPGGQGPATAGGATDPPPPPAAPEPSAPSDTGGGGGEGPSQYTMIIQGGGFGSRAPAGSREAGQAPSPPPRQSGTGSAPERASDETSSSLGIWIGLVVIAALALAVVLFFALRASG